jgi:hypothetical protein
MPNINRNFTGGLNLDDHEYRVLEGAYIDALNITRDSQGEAKDGVVSNILGNYLVNNALQGGENKIIGAYGDKLNNRVYFFNWNSNGYNGIYYYSINENTVTKILLSKVDSGGIDILKFNPSYKIYGVNVINRDISEGDLLYFNDNINEPRVINISDEYNVWLEEYIKVIKAPPQMPAKVTYENNDANSGVSINVLSGVKTIDQNLFTGGGQTDYITIDSITSSVFTLGSGGSELIYNGLNANINFNFTFGLFFNIDVGGAVIEILKNGVEIIGTSQNVSGFGGISYSKSFTEGVISGDIIKIRVSLDSPISYPTEFFICDGGSINGSTVTIPQEITVNNLRNSLFQFRYRFVFSNFEKSVWSSASIVPLPNQDTLFLTQDELTKNARISVSMSTGGLDVIKIELAGRRTKNGITSDWFLIKVFDKKDLVIDNNDILTYKFYNDGVYSTVDVLEAALLFDNVPKIARAQELINGNTLIYGGIKEGYDLIKPDTDVLINQNQDGFFIDYCGLLFFAQINGIDSGSIGAKMKIYIYGTGENVGGEVSQLNNSSGTFIINAVNNLGDSVGISVSNNTPSKSTNALLGDISTALQANGWVQNNLINNVLTVTYPSPVRILSSGVSFLESIGIPENTKYANAFDAGYEYALQYFDKEGRTNGASISAVPTFLTPSKGASDFCQPRLIINNRPPLWASYYQVLRSNNTTYGKRLSWVSQSAYSDKVNNILGEKYAYIGVGNINDYNKELTSTETVISYSYQQGDRVRFISRFSANGNKIPITIVDYEILGVANNIVVDGKLREGSFIKIYYPTNDINSGFLFDGTANFQNYEIFLYSYIPNQLSTQRPFFEFGKCFGIGNAGSSNAYHIGLNQTQKEDLSLPALIDIVNGDLFYRKRKVPVGQLYNIESQTYLQTVDYSTVSIVLSQPISIPLVYELNSNSPQQANLDLSSYPFNNSANPTYKNNSNTSQLIRVRGSLNTAIKDTNGGSITLYGKVCLTSGNPEISNIIPYSGSLVVGNSYNYLFDKIISIPSGASFWFVVFAYQAQYVSISELSIQYVANREIELMESSFSDVNLIVTNSNGRVSVVDENAKETYFPTLVRFSQSYQADTNINGTNRFFAENFDTYDRGFGDIMRFHIRDRYLKVYQKLKVGNVPVLTQIVKDVAGNPLQANTDQLINKIQYYSGDYGIGDSPCSLAWDNFSDYFVDDFRGVACRLSQDGITPISIIYKANSFFVDNLKAYRESLNNGIAQVGSVYMGNPTVYGAFDSFNNKYIVSLEEINRYSNPNTLIFHQDPYTIVFDEKTNQWESFHSYHPEFTCSVNTLFVSFKNGQLWVHNSNVYCNFYGVQYESYITCVFNNFSISKKTFISITEYANTIWDCPIITSQMNSYGSIKQESSLSSGNFRELESNYHSNFMRDINSIGGIINGSQLKGNYLKVKLRKNNANQYYFINLVSVNFIESPLNKQ